MERKQDLGDRMLRLKHIETLAVVLRSSSLAQAARTLGVSQPTVTKTLQRLEDLLKIKLFERVGNTLQPTVEALRLQEDAERLSQDITMFQAQASSLSKVGTGSVRIASVPSFAASVLPAIVSRYRSQWPDVRVECDILNETLIMQHAATGRIDLGFVHSPTENTPVASRTLISGEMVCIVPAGHQLARLDVVGPGELCGHDFISYRGGIPYASAIQAMLSAAGVELPIAIKVDLSTLLRDLVAQGSGVGLVDEFTLWGRLPREIEVRPFRPKIPVSVGVVFPHDQAISKSTEHFLDIADHMIRSEIANGNFGRFSQ